jgi:hypothetical protein
MRGESPPLLHVCACMAAQLRGALLLRQRQAAAGLGGGALLLVMVGGST